MSIFVRTLPNVMAHFGCSAEDAQRYMDLREEGYSASVAAVMAGLADPGQLLARRADRHEAEADRNPVAMSWGARE